MQLTANIASVLDRKGHELLSVSPEMTVFEALQRMADRDVGALAVLNDQRLVGLFSERDYARKVILLGKSSKETRVDEVMSHPAVTIGLQATVNEALGSMTKLRSRHLIVVEGDRAIGMVSIGDLVNWIISAQVEIIDHLQSYISGSYPV
ncbi:MAG: putative signal transduction protein [Bryobacterales bacterium]|jgi:CBS domain-containing protein|nr:putative signal transduction protein [Bryobacterales bacterium]